MYKHIFACCLLCLAIAPLGAKADVIIESVDQGSVLIEAGLLPDDDVLSWKIAKGRTKSQWSKGGMNNTFDWLWLKEEFAPRSVVGLLIKRNGVIRTLLVPAGNWGVEARPSLPASYVELYQRGGADVRQGNVAGGVAEWYRLLKKLNRQENRAASSWLLLKISKAWMQDNDSDKAIQVAKKALTFAPTKTSSYIIWDILAGLYMARNDFAAAAVASSKALRLLRSDPETLHFASSMSDFSSALWQRGRLKEAYSYALRALRIRERLAPNGYGVVESLNKLGVFSWIRGEIGLAGTYLRRAVLIQEGLEPGGLTTAGLLSNLGLVSWRLNELNDAELYLKRSLLIREALAPESEGLADTLNNLGNVARSVGNLQKAEDYRKQSLAIQKKLAPEGTKTADTLHNLGNLMADLGDSRAEEAYYMEALRIRKKVIPVSVQTAMSLYAVGLLWSDEGENNKALPILTEALDLFRRLAPNSDYHADALFAVGKVYRGLNQPKLALSYFEGSIEIIESQSILLGRDESGQSSFRERYWKTYRETIEAMLEQGQPEDAFRILEKYRARSFLAMVANRNIAMGVRLPKSLREKRERLILKRNKARHDLKVLDALGDSNKEVLLRLKLQDVEDEFSKFTDTICKREVHRSADRLATIDLNSLSKVLDEGTLLLSYSIGKHSSDVFAISSHGLLRVSRLPVGYDDLYGRLGLFRSLIAGDSAHRGPSKDRVTEISHVGRELYSTLLGPMDDLVAQSTRLLIIPDVPLHSLPWGVLTRDRGQGDYLARWKPLHLSMSATVYAELLGKRATRNLRDKDSLDFVGFGNPQNRRSNGSDRMNEIVSEEVLALRERGGFDAIPGSGREVEEIMKLFPGKSRSYVGAEATEENFKSLVRSVKIVHLATHAIIDAEDPLNSGLILATPQIPDHEDGVLQVWEILEQIQLDSDLVVLSSCESGFGAEEGAEGLSSLARAFQIAGARTVLASSWKVSDDIAAEFMVIFYKHLKAGQSKDASLRAAQVELSQDTRPVKNPGREGEVTDPSDPFFWAAFQLYGDWR